jgi:Na+/H+-translocating membrane pyrophosphatase
MTIAVYTNTRTTFSCCKGELINVGGESVKDLTDGFMTAFRGGQVLGFVLVGLAILVLIIFRLTFFEENADNIEHNGQPTDVQD